MTALIESAISKLLVCEGDGPLLTMPTCKAPMMIKKASTTRPQHKDATHLRGFLPSMWPFNIVEGVVAGTTDVAEECSLGRALRAVIAFHSEAVCLNRCKDGGRDNTLPTPVLYLHSPRRIKLSHDKNGRRKEM